MGIYEAKASPILFYSGWECVICVASETQVWVVICKIENAYVQFVIN